MNKWILKEKTVCGDYIDEWYYTGRFYLSDENHNYAIATNWKDKAKTYSSEKEALHAIDVLDFKNISFEPVELSEV